MNGLTRPSWEAKNSARYRGVTCCTLMRPNWCENEIQSCCSFHRNTGKNTRHAISPPAHSQGLRSQCRFIGSTKSQATTPRPRNRFVYLETQPSPANNPTTIQSQERLVRKIADRAQTVRDQNMVEGASGVLRIAPTLTRIIALNQSAARRATEWFQSCAP